MSGLETSPKIIPNILLKIEYDGTDFQGWQRQAGKPTIQAAIEDLLEELLGRRVVLYASGRTDSGVHARAQYANFWGDPKFTADQWARILNFKLPRSIRILESKEMPAHFHAQKRVLSKVYEFRLLNRNCASAFIRGTYFYPRYLNWEKIREALPYFVGEKDFKAFQGSKAQVKTSIRTISRFDLRVKNNELYIFEIEGTGFLKQMVRNMIGTLLEIGEGKREPSDIIDIIASRDRRKAGRTVPSSGLYLSSVKYPDIYELN